jgi:hypothetical protein
VERSRKYRISLPECNSGISHKPMCLRNEQKEMVPTTTTAFEYFGITTIVLILIVYGCLLLMFAVIILSSIVVGLLAQYR